MAETTNELAVPDFLFDYNAMYGLSTIFWPLRATSGLVGFFNITAAGILDY